MPCETHCKELLGSPPGLPRDVSDRERGRQEKRSLDWVNGSMSLLRSCLYPPPADEPGSLLVVDTDAILVGSGVNAASCFGIRNHSIWAPGHTTVAFPAVWVVL